MKQFFFAIIACLLPLAVNVSAQQTTRKTSHKTAGSSASKKEKTYPGYNFLVTINSDKSLRIEVVTGYELRDLDVDLLKKALSEYVMMQEPAPGRKPISPRVYIRPDQSLDVKTVIEVIKAARVSDSSEVTLELPDGPSLKIPKAPKPNQDVKPNPLFLLVQLDEKELITLNNEEWGSLSDLSPLTIKLKDIFHARAVNGVFREGTNEVEKTVYIKMPLSAKVADLIKIARALEGVAADPIGLQLDEIEWGYVVRRELIVNR
jgi:biopolymer transport protein ExbD